MTDALDGNAAAGVLSEIFATDLTVAVVTCAGCGSAHPLGELRAYLDAPGVVLRCTSCAAVEIRVVRGRDRIWLDLGGVRVMQIDAPPGAAAGAG
jgi:hypothetical protein